MPLSDSRCRRVAKSASYVCNLSSFEKGTRPASTMLDPASALGNDVLPCYMWLETKARLRSQAMTEP